MMRSTLPIFASCLMLSLFTLTSAPALAQTPAACDIDLSQTTALLIQAQAKASSGDVDGGLALLTQAQDNLAQIQATCGAESTATPEGPALALTYISPSKAFSLSYPEGWITAPQPVSNNGEKPPLEAVFLASDQATIDAINENEPTDTLNGIVVYVGTPQQIVIGLGAFQPDKNYDTLDAKGLLDTIVGSIPSSANLHFQASEPVTVNAHPAAESTFSFSASSGFFKLAYDGTLLMVPLSDNRFAALLGVVTPGQSETLQALLQSVAASIQLS